MLPERTLIGAVLLAAALAGCGPPHAPASPVTRHLQTAEHHVPGPAIGPRRATTAPPPVHTPGDPDDDEPHTATTQLSAARPVARAFFASYIAYLYRRRPPTRVAEADPALRAQLEHGHAKLTPTERASRPHLAHLSITSAGPPVSVVAVALVDAGPGCSSRLTATLEPRRGKWVVVAIAG
jgi:hypothetical protein